MPKVARRKPAPLDTPWDLGPNTAAQWHMARTEPADYTDPETGKRTNPNGVRRKKRVDFVTRYAGKGLISKRQLAAAVLLRDSWEATMKSPPAIKKVQVDTFPNPDAAIAIQVDRMGRFHNVMRYVPQIDKVILEHVVINNRSIPSLHGGTNAARARRYMKRLRDALERLADRLEGAR